ncbi:pyridoxal-phosphate dependent enzyme [Arthrobacter sp. PAMC25284]|uniref:pyridoxal-phosphate dependent enzyme n=1 Tax=Arthrobacter sp. PAMC25284 TaxID=2861279 RepID=UPI0035C0B063
MNRPRPPSSPAVPADPSGSHRVEGIGIGFIPPLWEPDQIDAIEQVTSADAMIMGRRLARETGIFAGTSTGADVAAALRVAERLGPGSSVVAVIVDSGLRYLSTDLYR